MLGKRLRVKLLLLLALLASTAGVGMDNSSACGYVKCAVILTNGQVVGYGCSMEPPGLQLGGCSATVSGCRFTPCI